MRFRSRILIQLAWLVVLSTVGAAILTRTTRDVPQARFLPVVLILVILFLAGAGARRIAWHLARPIEKLAEASRRFGAGDLSTRVKLFEPRLERHLRRHFASHRHHKGQRQPLDELVALGRDWNEMAERIERLVRAQRELLANVSHELRSPLARIRVALELLPRTSEAAGRIDEVIADIEELDRLIDDVLTAARLDGTPVLRPSDLDLGELLESVRARAEHDPLCAGLEVHVEGSGTTRGDAALLRRALWNLVENAAKHGAPPVTLRAAHEDGALRLSVIDHGPGIPESERAGAAEPFVRGDGARTPASRAGVGLGLTIARRVAEAHGGVLLLEAGPDGHGLEATLRLPFTNPSSAEQTSLTSRAHDAG